MLENILCAYEHYENEIDAIKHSPYYSVSKLPTFLCLEKDNFIILSINIDGLLSKIDELRILLELLKKQNIIFDAICIQESHLDHSYRSDSACIQLHGYDCIPQGKTCGQKGGLVTYIKHDFESCKYVIGETTGIWEGLYVEIKDNERNFRMILCNIYKPPRNNNNNHNIECFTRELIPKLKLIDELNCEIALAGDFDIDLLKLHERLKFQALFDDLTNLSLFPKITLPTRIGTQSSTLIDNIYCKLTHRTINTKAGIIFSDLSDHFPYFVSIDLRNKKKTTPKLVKQKFSTPNAVQNFKNELMNHDFSKDFSYDSNADPNTTYEKFIDKLTEIKNKHIPIKMVKFNKHKHKKENWITFGIIKSIKFRDNLNLKLKNSIEYEGMKQTLKTYNGIRKKNIRDAKAKYHTEIFEKYKAI